MSQCNGGKNLQSRYARGTYSRHHARTRAELSPNQVADDLHSNLFLLGASHRELFSLNHFRCSKSGHKTEDTQRLVPDSRLSDARQGQTRYELPCEKDT